MICQTSCWCSCSTAYAIVLGKVEDLNPYSNEPLYADAICQASAGVPAFVVYAVVLGKKWRIVKLLEGEALGLLPTTTWMGIGSV